jgi:hypothetical protein
MLTIYPFQNAIEAVIVLALAVKYIRKALRERERDEKWYELLITNPDGKGLPGGRGHNWVDIVTLLSDS